MPLLVLAVVATVHPYLQPQVVEDGEHHLQLRQVRGVLRAQEAETGDNLLPRKEVARHRHHLQVEELLPVCTLRELRGSMLQIVLVMIGDRTATELSLS